MSKTNLDIRGGGLATPITATGPRAFRKKPVVIQAMRLTEGTEWEALREFCPTVVSQSGHRAMIPTLEGQMVADVGDWIIRGVKGEFYPCKPDIFEATYEEVRGA
jgi:hypothetical protein